MAEEQALGVSEQSDANAAATPNKQRHGHRPPAAPPAPPLDGAGDGTLAAAADEAQRADAASAQPQQDLAGELDELAATAAQRDQYLALAQRTQADFENYRKRVARDAAAGEVRGLVKLARELLPALDNLDRALGHAEEADPALIEGLVLVQRELVGALQRAGIESYGAPGERFDPELHEAVAQQPFDGAEAGEIVEVYQSGYRLVGGGLIRPARVLVAG